MEDRERLGKLPTRQETTPSDSLACYFHAAAFTFTASVIIGSSHRHKLCCATSSELFRCPLAVSLSQNTFAKDMIHKETES